ncbi:MAG: hypothetical protein Kow0092_07360 [Deferrisomatales bacterium]
MTTSCGPDPGRFPFLDRIRELPSLPQVLVGITRVASNPQAGAEDLADVILKDQAMTLKVLRIANSARYAVCSQRVTTVSRAVILLGFDSVRALTLGLGAYNLLSALERGGRVHEGFWKSSIAVAVACQELARLVGVPVAEEAFVAGLLHDVGKLVLAQHDFRRACRVYGRAAEGPALLAREREAFGVTHVQVAEELARRWELPAVLRKALVHHHRHFPTVPEDPGERLAFLVGVAKSLIWPLWQEGADPGAEAAKVARILRAPAAAVGEILGGLAPRIEEYAEYFEIQMDDLKAYTLWLEDAHERLRAEVGRAERSRRREERRQAELAVIREVQQRVVRGAALDPVVERVLRASRELAGARRSVAALVEAPSGALQGRWGDGDVTPVFLEAFRFPPEEGGVLAGALDRGEPVHVLDVRMPFFRRLISARERDVLDASSFAAVPLFCSGRSVGLLYGDRNPGDEPFSDGDLETLVTLGDLLSLALSRGD